MSKHAERTSFVKPLSRGQWAKIAAAVAAVGLIATAGVISRDFYQSSTATPSITPTSFSATDGAASRSASRGALKSTTYVTVKVNGKSRVVLGEKANMTTVKDVLETGDIVLDPEDSVTPSLDSKVSESTVISINRANTTVETTDTDIAFNEVRKETSSLPNGQEKVETEGEKGVLETTSLVTRSGDKVVSSNVFTSWVKKAPVDKVILVGTSTVSSPSAASLGTTTPAGEIQSWAHDYLISNGYSEADFTAANLGDAGKGAGAGEVMIHELVHQWWGLGNMFDTSDPTSPWSAEGLTVYTTYRIVKELYGEDYAQEHYVDQWQKAVDDYYLNFYVRNPEYLEMLPEQVQLAISNSLSQVRQYNEMPLKIYKAEQLVGGEEAMDQILHDLFNRELDPMYPYLTYQEFLDACGLTEEDLNLG